MHRTVRIIAVKEYRIKEKSIREGSYGEEIQALLEAGNVNAAFDAALAYDQANIDEGQFSLDEIGPESWGRVTFEWDGNLTADESDL